MSRHGIVGALLLAITIAGCKRETDKPEPVKALPPSSTTTPSKAPANAVPEPSSAGVVRLDAKASAEDELGYSVAVADGRVAVSAFKRRAAGNEEHPGSVLIYELKQGRAVFETELVAEKSHQLGNAIAFDGKTLVAGAMYDAGSKPETGAAYAFTRGADGWSKAVKLSSPKSQADDSFGIGVAIAGGAAVIGNSREAGGSLFVFEPAKTGFALKQTMPFPDPSGPAETMAAHGSWLAVGAQFAGEEEQGSVRVYEKRDAGLAEAAVLSEPQAAKEHHFGGAVGVGPRSIAVASEKQLTIFENKDGKFQASAAIAPPIATGLADAAIAIDDSVLAIGLPIVEEGRVLVYRKQGSDWKLERVVRSPEGKKGDWFGFSLALGPNLLVIGAPFENERAGAAYSIKL